MRSLKNQIQLLTLIVGDREKVMPTLPRLNLGAASELVPV